MVRVMPSSETPAPAAAGRPKLDVAVVMRRERLHGPSSHWQPWRWTLDSVVPDETGLRHASRACCSKTTSGQRWLHPGFKVELFRDDAEGYHLNATTAGAVLVRAVAHGRGSDIWRRNRSRGRSS